VTRSNSKRLISELQCGGIFLNAMVASDPRLPSRINAPATGANSQPGMREFLNAKTIVIGRALHDPC